MKHTSLHTLLATIAAYLTILVSSSFAAVAPMDIAALTKRADHIVTGEVLQVTSKVQKPELENAKGYHRDLVFTITVKIRKISKGSGLKVGQEIEVIAWKPHTRIPPLPGPQGHSPIPAKGDTATFYLYVGAEKQLKPIHPNGIALTK